MIKKILAGILLVVFLLSSVSMALAGPAEDEYDVMELQYELLRDRTNDFILSADDVIENDEGVAKAKEELAYGEEIKKTWDLWLETAKANEEQAENDVNDDLEAKYELLIISAEKIKVELLGWTALLEEYVDSKENVPEPVPEEPEVCLDSETEEYAEYDEEFEDYEDDYRHFKKKYNHALDWKNSDVVAKYEYKLEKLDKSLRHLEDDVDDLMDNVEDQDDCENQEALLDNLEDLEDDIEDLREAIDYLLYGKHKGSSYAKKSKLKANFVPKIVEKTEDKQVIVKTLDFVPPAQNVEPVVEEASTWEETRQTTLMVSGVIILAGVVIFLLGMLFRR